MGTSFPYTSKFRITKIGCMLYTFGYNFYLNEVFHICLEIVT